MGVGDKDQGGEPRCSPLAVSTRSQKALHYRPPGSRTRLTNVARLSHSYTVVDQKEKTCHRELEHDRWTTLDRAREDCNYAQLQRSVVLRSGAEGTTPQDVSVHRRTIHIPICLARTPQPKYMAEPAR